MKNFIIRMNELFHGSATGYQKRRSIFNRFNRRNISLPVGRQGWQVKLIYPDTLPCPPKVRQAELSGFVQLIIFTSPGNPAGL